MYQECNSKQNGHNPCPLVNNIPEPRETTKESHNSIVNANCDKTYGEEGHYSKRVATEGSEQIREIRALIHKKMTLT